MSYKKNGAILSNVKYFLPTSLVYEKNPNSILVHAENNMQDQQNYTYGNPIQDDIYQYRYDSFLVSNRDSDIKIKPYTEITLPDPGDKDVYGGGSKKTTLGENVVCGAGKDENAICGAENVVCGVGEDSYSVCGTNQKLYKILDPKFNLREVAKNCILLEDHLFHYGKRCSDCIKKHSLMIEGFLEEGLTLDKNREHTDEFTELIKEFREIFKKLFQELTDGTITDSECIEFAQEIRKLRKPLLKYATFC